MPFRTTDDDDKGEARLPPLSPSVHYDDDNNKEDGTAMMSTTKHRPEESQNTAVEENLYMYNNYDCGDNNNNNINYDDETFARRLQQQWKEKRLRLSMEDGEDNDKMILVQQQRQQQEQSDEDFAKRLQNEELTKRYETFARSDISDPQDKKQQKAASLKKPPPPPRLVTPVREERSTTSNSVSMRMMTTGPIPVPGTLRYSAVGRHSSSSPTTANPSHSKKAVAAATSATTTNIRNNAFFNDKNNERNDAGMSWRNRRQLLDLATTSSSIMPGGGDETTTLSDITSLPGAIRVGDTNESEIGTVQIGSSSGGATGNYYHQQQHRRGGDGEQGNIDEDTAEEEGESDSLSGRIIGHSEGQEDREIREGEEGTTTTSSLPILEAEIATVPIMAEQVRRDLPYGRSMSSDAAVLRRRERLANKYRRYHILGTVFIVLSLLVVAVVVGVNVWKRKQDRKNALEQPITVEIRFEELTIVIQLDGKPEETGWSLSCGPLEGSEIEFPPGVYEGRPFDLVVHSEELMYQEECTFTIVDSGGDGIDGGYFEVYKGDDTTNPEAQVIRGSGFTDSMSVSFTLDSPTPSMFPTHVVSESPTICLSEAPSRDPSMSPTQYPSMDPTQNPSTSPSLQPSEMPSFAPSRSPSTGPSAEPSEVASSAPSLSPGSPPSVTHSEEPSKDPTLEPTDHPSSSPSTLAPTETPSIQPSHPPTPCHVVPQGECFHKAQSITLLRRDGLCLTEQDLTVLEDAVKEGYNVHKQSIFDTCSPFFRRIISSVADRGVLTQCVQRQLTLEITIDRNDKLGFETSRNLPASAAEVMFNVQICCTPDDADFGFEDFGDTKNAMIGHLESFGTYVILGFDIEVTSFPSSSPTQPPTLPPTARPTLIPTPQPSTPPPTHRPTLPPTPRPTPAPTPRPTSQPTPRPTPSPTQRPTIPPETPPPTTPRPTPSPTSSPTPRPTPSPTTEETHPIEPPPTPSPEPEPPTNCHDYPSSYCSGSTWCSGISDCGEGTQCVECYGDGHCDWEAGEICDCDPNSGSPPADGKCKQPKNRQRGLARKKK